MKKMLCILLLLTIAVCLFSGCRKKPSAQNGTTAPTSASEESTEETVTEPATEATTTPTTEASTVPPTTETPATAPAIREPTIPPATKEPTIPPTTTCNHTYNNATCTLPRTCSKCSATEGAAAGHRFVEATCTTPKTCSTCGATEGAAAGHRFIDATCTAPKTCSTCGATEGAAAGHRFVDATCTAPKTCSMCGATEGTAAGHSFIAVTCTTPKTCTKCGATDGTAVDHQFVEESATDGHKTGSKIAYRCTLCQTIKEITIEKLSVLASRSSEASINGWLSSVEYTATASGGYGSYQYRFEVYTSQYSTSPALTEDYSANNSFSWASRNYCNGNVLKVSVKDEGGNIASMRIVVDTNDASAEIPLVPPATEPPTTEPPTTSNTEPIDTTAPVIASVSVDRQSVTVGDTVTVTMKVLDESAIKRCAITIRMSNGGDKYCYLSKDSDGLYRGYIAIDDTFVEGRCSSPYMSVEDIYGNINHVASPDTDFPDFFFEVTGVVSDADAPVIESVSVDQQSVTTGDTVAVTMKISDDSAIKRCSITIRMSNGENKYCFLSKDSDGLYRGYIAIDDTFVEGRCSSPYMSVEDTCGNVRHEESPETSFPNFFFDVVR